MTPKEIVDLLSPTTPDLSARMAFCSKEHLSSNGKSRGRSVYVTFRDSAPTVEELVEVAHGRMVNFALPRQRIESAKQKMLQNPWSIDPWVDLVTEARDLFIKTKNETGRSGELGELLLFMLLEWKERAPIVACKMYLKTSQQMPIHGVDGIHLSFDGENIVIFWGESKLHQQFSSAVDDIIESISGVLANPKTRENEVRLIRSNMNFDGLDPAALLALKAYFDPFQEQSNHVIDKYACLAAFDYPQYEKMSSEKPNECVSKFESAFAKRSDEAWKLVTSKLSAAKLDEKRFAFFIFPLPSVDAARAAFQAKLWGHQ